MNLVEEIKKITIWYTGGNPVVDIKELKKLSNRLEKLIILTEPEHINGGWISVNDRRPDEGEQVLVFFDWGDHTDINIYTWDKWFKSNCITHWMKLPKLPSYET